MANLNSDFLDDETISKLDDQKVIGRPLTMLNDFELNKVVGALDDAVTRTTDDLGGGGPLSTLSLSDVDGAVNAATGLAKLNAFGKLPDSTIPSLAINDIFTVADETAMLSLSTAQQGDIACRTDTSTAFILSQTPAATLGNWKSLGSAPIPADFNDGGDTAGANRILGNLDAFDLDFYTDGSSILKLNADGSSSFSGTLGVQVAAPTGSVQFHVQDASTTQMLIETTAGNASADIICKTSTTQWSFGAGTQGGDDNLYIGEGAGLTTRMKFHAGGNVEVPDNVGIGGAPSGIAGEVLNLTTASGDTKFIIDSTLGTPIIEFRRGGVNKFGIYVDTVRFLIAPANKHGMRMTSDGRVSIGNNDADASAQFVVLEGSAGKKGSIPAIRHTETNRDLIASPVTGLQVYNTTTNKMNFYNGTEWREVSDVVA